MTPWTCSFLETCREEMDLESEVCADSSSSLVFVPYKENFTPGSLHTCSKFSGKVFKSNRA